MKSINWGMLISSESCKRGMGGGGGGDCTIGSTNGLGLQKCENKRQKKQTLQKLTVVTIRTVSQYMPS
jgi:hypothetical protein